MIGGSRRKIERAPPERNLKIPRKLQVLASEHAKRGL
jgi:hypothetical protein